MSTMHTLRRRALGGVAAVAAFALTGCAGGNGPRKTDSIRIILGHGAAPGNPRSNAALHFEKLVEEKSNKTIDIQILGQETVGSDSEMMVSVAAGTLDMTINSQARSRAMCPRPPSSACRSCSRTPTTPTRSSTAKSRPT